MKRNRQIVALIVLNLVLYAVINEANFYLTPLGIALHLDVLLVFFAAIRLRIVHGMIIVLVLGMTAGAFRPEVPGGTLLTLLTVWFVCLLLRPVIRRENPIVITSMAILLQFFVLAGRTAIYTGHLLDVSAVWQRLLLDTGISLLILAMVTTTWCEFQRRVLLMMGWDLNAESQRV